MNIDKKLLLIVTPFLLLSCTQEAVKIQPSASDIQVLKLQAVAKIKSVAKVLKPQLKSALQKGGAVHAVQFCSIQSPKIGKQANQNSEWKIKRVSLKNRSPMATPDSWERAVLKHFDSLVATGQKVDAMSFSEVIDGEFRFMKPQGVKGVCLTCHGQNIAPAVKAEIFKHYPEDRAFGYALGEVRGAFSLRKKL
jgi:hypothetical protein